MKKTDRSPRFSKIASALRRNSALLLELALLALLGISFALPILDMNKNLSLPGVELGSHIGQMQLMIDWLNGKAEFPLWNPAMNMGRSWIADPFLSAYNPFILVPMWLLGLNNGAKVAVFINFLLAGFGMWLVTRLLGFRWPTRLWASMLYMMSGGMVAHLLVGQVQLVFSLGWLPWSFAGLLWVWQKKTLTSAAVASLAQALFFFTGHLYHQVYAGACYIIIILIMVVKWRPLKLDLPGFWKVMLMGILSLGLISIQLVPALVAQKDITNLGGFAENEEEFYGSQKPVDALLNYIVPERQFSELGLLGKVGFFNEGYRYIGITPFLLSTFLLIPAFKGSKRKREMVAIGLSFLLLLCWTAVRYTFFKDLYHNLPFLNQFRYPGRALNVGAMFIILLGGFGLEELLTRIDAVKAGLFLKGHQDFAKLSLSVRIVLLGAVLLGLAWSVRDVYAANSQYVTLETDTILSVDNAFRWLHTREEASYSVGIYATGTVNTERGWYSYYEHFRILSFGDGWIPAGAPVDLGRPESITIGPKYWFMWKDEPLDVPGAKIVKTFGTLVVWEGPAFPFAFTVPDGRLEVEPYALTPDEVQPAASFTRQAPNKISVETDVREATVLVLSESWSAGWTVKVDGKSTDVSAVSSLLAVPLTAGKHTVTFQFAPASFWPGVVLTFIALLDVAIILISGLVRRRQNTAAPASVPEPQNG